MWALIRRLGPMALPPVKSGTITVCGQLLNRPHSLCRFKPFYFQAELSALLPRISNTRVREGGKTMSRVALSTRDCSLASRFQSVCETLKQDRFSDRMSKPLAFWVLPNDRRLPLALLNRTIGELICTAFDDLAATPGIGRKKISSLVNLMVRATSDEPPSVPFGSSQNVVHPAVVTDQGNGNGNGNTESKFDAYLVSEALWSQWTAVVREFGLGDETIGRIADSLNNIPTVIWTKSLGEYENLTLSQIRGLRTHGEKRVRCVMEVMHKAYVMAQRHRNDSNAIIRRNLGSQRILEVANWVERQIRSENYATVREVRQYLADPILKQIAVDCGDTVHTVAKQRLGIEGDILSVREQAQSMGVTRARIYQLLEDCHKVIEVRWPHGRVQLDRLTAKLGAQLGDSGVEDPSLFISTRQLCFPDRNHDERIDGPHALNRAPHFIRD